MSAYGSSRFQSVLDDGSLAVLDQIGGTSTQKKASDENDTRVRPAALRIVEQEDEDDKKDKQMRKSRRELINQLLTKMAK